MRVRSSVDFRKLKGIYRARPKFGDTDVEKTVVDLLEKLYFGGSILQIKKLIRKILSNSANPTTRVVGKSLLCLEEIDGKVTSVPLKTVEY